MLKTPSPPKEDPAIRAAQLREQSRAEAQQTSQSQSLLSAETLDRVRRYGNLPGSATLGYSGVAAPPQQMNFPGGFAGMGLRKLFGA